MNIYYNPDNPSEVTQTKSMLLPIILIVGGLGAFIGGFINGFKVIKKYKEMHEQDKEREMKK